MADTIYVDIVSAEGAIFSGSARMVAVPAIMGEIGILPGHSPLLTKLKPGEIRIKLSDEEELPVYILGGLLEIQPSAVTILADTALRIDAIDGAAMVAAKGRAEENKRKSEKAIQQGIPLFDYAKARQELSQAIAQLQILEKLQKRSRKGKKSFPVN
uniref:ATP synthase epsilon chain n=1 Tax=Candidatus Kentrum sp. LPFa TaxID=2126335 RepID=A0A450WN05_9GAMM|nr:MAG: F-type H+-transporting ATPase subunit epsilon [Candidatus Kentron sp. LPFa]